MEGAPFIVNLLSGHGSVAGYRALLTQLRAVYTTMEQAEASVSDDVLAGPFADPRLHRVDRIEADLAAIPAAGDGADLLDATVAYTRRILASVQEWPSAFVAHHYLRYLGDLSGGQVIARMLQRHYDVTTDQLTFFDFDGIKPKPFKDDYRVRLDTTPWDGPEQARLVEEARQAYEFNRAIFDELGATIGSRGPLAADVAQA